MRRGMRRGYATDILYIVYSPKEVFFNYGIQGMRRGMRHRPYRRNKLRMTDLPIHLKKRLLRGFGSRPYVCSTINEYDFILPRIRAGRSKKILM